MGLLCLKFWLKCVIEAYCILHNWLYYKLIMQINSIMQIKCKLLQYVAYIAIIILHNRKNILDLVERLFFQTSEWFNLYYKFWILDLFFVNTIGVIIFTLNRVNSCILENLIKCTWYYFVIGNNILCTVWTFFCRW